MDSVPRTRRRFSQRRVALLVVDLVSTVLTILTAIRENAVIMSITGHSNLLRARLLETRINDRILRAEQIDRALLPDFVDVGAHYHFYTAPERGPASLGEDRSICLRINSMSVASLVVNFDDAFGEGPRREQLFAYSISPPRCEVVNLQATWLAQDCIRGQFGGNDSACYAYILAHFDALAHERQWHVAVATEFGAQGVPMLRCSARPMQRFPFVADYLVLQSFWAGSRHHVEVQSSHCWALPVAEMTTDQYGDAQLFRVAPVDARATVVVAVHPSHWLLESISSLYHVITLVLIVRGLLIALFRVTIVYYVPVRMRRRLCGLFTMPLVDLARVTTKPLDGSSQGAATAAPLTCEGDAQLISNLWMNHWLYIWLSIADACINLRTMYIVLEMGTWMLSKNVDVHNFLFVCSALTRITWIMCLVHTLFRFMVKAVLRVLSGLRLGMGRRVYAFMDWYVDAVAMCISYKMYSVLLCVVLGSLLQLNGSITLMKRGLESAVLGGFPNTLNVWGSEVACDLFVTCALQLVLAHILGAVLLCTPLRTITSNRVLVLMQKRFIFVGWDVYVTMEALGVDPLNPGLLHHGVTTTNCSLAAVLRQMYTSGPSGWVQFVGDDALPLSSSNGAQRVLTHYPMEMALTMGLCTAPVTSAVTALGRVRSSDRISEMILQHSGGDRVLKRHTSMPHAPTRTILVRQSSKPIDPTGSHPIDGDDDAAMQSSLQRSATSEPIVPPPFCSRVLQLHSESTWGRLLFVDNQLAPGQVIWNEEARQPEVAVPDVLQFLQEQEIHDLFGTARIFHIC